jgi:tetratricopeptide (TPR) repeat protein
LKLISGILGVGFDELRQREQARRHRRMALVTAASVTGMVIAIALATTAWLARVEADRQRARAEAEAETARQTTTFLVGLFKVSDPSESRAREIKADELLEKGAARIETELADQPDIQATLMDTMGSVYTNLGAYTRARDLLEQSLATRERIRGPRDIKVAQSLNRLARVQMLKAEYVLAEEKHRRALELQRELLGEPHVDIAASMNELGDVLTGFARRSKCAASCSAIVTRTLPRPSRTWR